MKIDLKPPDATWRKVTSSAGEFEVLIRRPTYEEQGAEGSGDKPWILHRIETTVTDWRGVETEDQPNVPSKPIPFSRENLAALCQIDPAVFNQLLVYAHEAYRGLTADAGKNSEPPSSDSSAAGG